ncbi:DLW-39 family protein [Enemella evansiae]|uniref:DLW-39 family protein n=1 Tax=Enemella evansiae TaxID=2016499 RepID=UPI000C0058C3|nr:DLW-39 family protein [Enemella evansiae]PFG69192.1 hypothetical protein B0O41_4045 [Propionibacteriaceae bacterium ES.041]TDO89463.1 hypothetical protein C8D81_2335 [Enemella evansiae]
MKKLLVLLAGVVGTLGVVMVRQNRKAQAEAELWAEATDPLSPTERPPHAG